MTTLHLAVALDGAGWHPAAWREPDARPRDLFTAGYWVDLVREAERGLLDFVTIDDALRLQSDDPRVPDERTDRVRGRLDAVLVAARVAPTTRHIGLVPTAIVTHTEPFHLSKAIATLDYVSQGRAGVQVRVSGLPHEARHFGRRTFPDDLFAEAADYVEVLRRLWDSWEDDAEIRDAATGRFVDRDKLHYIDFTGRWFSVKGPSITPRPPQGQPIVAALGHRDEPYRLIAGSTDIGFVTPRDRAHAETIVGRTGDARIFADLVVFLGADAAERRERLDGVATLTSDATVFAGTAIELADLMLDWQPAGLAGFRLRPATIPYDLERITRDLVPELQRRGVFRTGYEAATLRGLLGLPRPANRYATVQGR
ncbi:MAG TPA: LLM class flavin-dependent oxidoreductase [Pseudonocardiaceae bacterium]|nr:LLM class flavin-dependent oxidoreductase [Pseudonocardiaceae bacterium]